MSRYFQQISESEFKKIIQNSVSSYELPTSVTDDIAKVDFDTENITLDGVSALKYPIGYRTLDNGMIALFASAGGDSQLPVCFVIYFDGKKLRGYVPTKGNVWHYSEKRAYTNDEITHDVLKLSDENLLIQDVMNRIQPASEKNVKVVKVKESKDIKIEFNQEQSEWIQECKEEYDIDLSKGFYWQLVEEVDFEDPCAIIINPKDFWRKEKCLFDQHTQAEIFIKDQNQARKLGESMESMFEFDGTQEEFEQMMQDNAPFFEHKIMFTEE